MHYETKQYHILPLVVALIIAAFFVWNYAGLKTDFADHQGGHHFQQMLQGNSVPSPYCYRVLVPILSFASVAMAYFWMALGLGLSGWGLYLLTKELGGDDFAGWVAMLLFMLWPDICFQSMFWFVVPDPFAYAGLIFATLWGLRREWLLATLAITVGVISREVVLLAIPFLFLMAPRKQWRQLFLLVLIPIVTWLLLIINITPSAPVIQGEDTLNILDRFIAIRKIRAGGYLESWSWLWKSFMVIGPLWLFGYQLLKDKRVLWFMIACSLVFISGDTVRMILYGVPAIIPVAALGLSCLVPAKYRLLVAGVAIGVNSLRFKL